MITTWGGLSQFGMENLHTIPASAMNPPGQLVRTIAAIHAIRSYDYDTLVEDRSGRFNGER